MLFPGHVDLQNMLTYRLTDALKQVPTRYLLWGKKNLAFFYLQCGSWGHQCRGGAGWKSRGERVPLARCVAAALCAHPDAARGTHWCVRISAGAEDLWESTEYRVFPLWRKSAFKGGLWRSVILKNTKIYSEYIIYTFIIFRNYKKVAVTYNLTTKRWSLDILTSISPVFTLSKHF